MADSTDLFIRIVQCFHDYHVNHFHFLLLSMFVIDALWCSRHRCRFSGKKMKVEDTLAFVRRQTNAFHDSFIPLFLNAPRTYRYRNMTLDRNIMTANVIFHVDGSFIKNGNFAGWPLLCLIIEEFLSVQTTGLRIVSLPKNLSSGE